MEQGRLSLQVNTFCVFIIPSVCVCVCGGGLNRCEGWGEGRGGGEGLRLVSLAVATPGSEQLEYNLAVCSAGWHNCCLTCTRRWMVPGRQSLQVNSGVAGWGKPATGQSP